MKIALNMATLRGAGSKTIGTQVLRAMCENYPENEYTLWHPDSWSRALIPDNCTAVSVASGAAAKFKTENLAMRHYLKSNRHEVLFSLGDTGMPYAPLPHLLMVQQAYLAYRPEDWGFVPGWKFRAKMRLITEYFRLGHSRVDAFTVQTQDMKARLCDRWNISEDKVHVIPSAITTSRAPKSEETPPAPYLCYVATPAPHKNFAVLPAMMAKLDGPHDALQCHLTVTQEEVPELVARAMQLGVLHKFQFLGRLSHAQCTQRIAQASVCIIPSLLESFGLLYYEAMALGTPIVAADRSFAREACGEYARYVAPHDGGAYARQVVAVIESPCHKKRSIEQTWATTALSYINLLTSIGSRNTQR